MAKKQTVRPQISFNASLDDRKNVQYWIDKLNELEPKKKYNQTTVLKTLLASKEYVIKPFLKKDALILLQSFNKSLKTMSLLNQISRNLTYFKKQNTLDEKEVLYLEKDIIKLRQAVQKISNDINKLYKNDHENQ